MAPPPTNILTMTPKIFLQVRPQVYEHLQHWIDRARKIPSPELQEQALASIAAKTFHCEGGGIYSLLAGDRHREAIRFIVAYQTISDYLDNLCDRGTSLDPDDFRILHTSMQPARSLALLRCRGSRAREVVDEQGLRTAHTAARRSW